MGNAEQIVPGIVAKPSPDNNSGLITPACLQQRPTFTPARILTKVTRHESRMPEGEVGKFIPSINNELIQDAEMVDKGGGGGELLLLMPKFGVWNVRGINSDTKQRDMKWYMHHASVSLFGLLETRVKPRSLNKVAKNICEGWSFTTNHNYHNSGRIWVLWKNNQIKIDIIEKNAQYIHFKATNIEGHEFFVTFVYGYNKIEERVPLWRALMSWNINQPWDMKTTGAFFTWTNKQPSKTRVYSRIDRVLVNNEWMRVWPDYYAYFALKGYFDHCPCIVDCVSARWNCEIQGTSMFKVVKKLKLLKPLLKNWNRQLFSDVERNTDIAYAAMVDCQKKLQADPMNKVLSYLMLAQTREDYLRQKSKAHWAKDGDDNTAMFHKIIQQRNIQNKVMRIEDIKGKCYTTPEDILQAFVEY
ncbi:uncharacterized protein LOC141655414 [Silene latifolia]|uniref:uncharacterized protein LOC141655414 n=1 Tax=Silene latifolia TaxID=37657 RepID=UPI003D773190